MTTLNVARGPETTYVTQTELVLPSDKTVSMETVEQLRYDLEQRLSTFSTARVNLFFELKMLRIVTILTLGLINSSLNESNVSTIVKIDDFLIHKTIFDQFIHFWTKNVENCCYFDTRSNQFVFERIKFQYHCEN